MGAVATSYGPTDAIYPAAVESAQPSEYLRRGFATLALRPNAYVWRLLGEREVGGESLAMLEAAHEELARTRPQHPSTRRIAAWLDEARSP